MEEFLKKLTGSGNRRMIYFYLGVAVVFLIEVFILITFLPPTYARLRGKMVMADTRGKEVSSYTNALSMLESLDSSGVDGYLAKVLLALPDEKKISGVISGMTALASSSGVVVTDLEFSPGIVATISAETKNNAPDEKVVDENLNVRMVPASLTIIASVDSLIDFLKKLSTASQLIGVSAVSYSVDRPGQVKATIAIAIYYQPRDISKFSWQNLRAIPDEDIGFIQSLPGEDLFVLRDQAGF